MGNFYKRKVVNYRGTTSDSKEYYTEVVAEWILKNIYLFDYIKPITREKSYKVDSHDGKNKDNDSNREEEKIANVKVKDDQLSLAIGKKGQNVRLAAKLTGWKIDIKAAE